MKKYKVWIECEREIKANSLHEAIKKFANKIKLTSALEIDFNACEIK